MKIIDLLNKIANDEELPKRIKFYGKHYTWYDNEYTGNKGYCLEPLKSDSNSFLEINTVYDLNYEVEIIEEQENKKIEYIGKVYDLTKFAKNFHEPALLLRDLCNKIRELIDEVNEINKQKQDNKEQIKQMINENEKWIAYFDKKYDETEKECEL